MENRKKFYANYGKRKQTGVWGADTLQDRYEHVCGALKAYDSHILDDMDLTFAIKNAFVSKVYVSCGVVKAYPPNPKNLSLFGNLSGLYTQIVNNGVLDLLKPPSNALHCDYLNICELGTIVNPLVPKKALRERIHIEHVVPGKVYIDNVINLYQNSKFTFTEFKEIFNAVSICLVTKAEDNILNAVRESDGKGIKYRMPYGSNSKTIVYKTNPFARYQRAGIKIWKQCNQPCPGAANCLQIP